MRCRFVFLFSRLFCVFINFLVVAWLIWCNLSATYIFATRVSRRVVLSSNYLLIYLCTCSYVEVRQLLAIAEFLRYLCFFLFVIFFFNLKCSIVLFLFKYVNIFRLALFFIPAFLGYFCIYSRFHNFLLFFKFYFH